MVSFRTVFYAESVKFRQCRKPIVKLGDSLVIGDIFKSRLKLAYTHSYRQYDAQGRPSVHPVKNIVWSYCNPNCKLFCAHGKTQNNFGRITKRFETT